jgi:nitroimidazol reductase NimA-like FMN-containing flavoprotein (pyridoxamine 5'-phosphate oxidase superfamily)
MPRESIAMSTVECVAFLAAQRWVALGTLDAGGGPWSSLAPAALDGDSLYFGVPEASREQRNLARDARACCAADQFPSYYEIRGVTAHGRARSVTDPAELARVKPRLDPKGLPGWHRDAALAVFALPLDDLFSFDFAKIRNQR